MMENNLTWQEFERVAMYVGTIVEVNDFPRLENRLTNLTIDFEKLLE
jgi:tRNA-binding protein